MSDGSSYDDDYYAFSRPEAGLKNKVDTMRDNLIRRQVLRRVSGGRLLDVGCGIGLFLKTMSPPFEQWGMDLSEYAVAQCRERLPQAHLAVASLSDGIPFDEQFDVISAINIFEHLDRPLDAALVVRESLRPGGLLVAHLPTIGNPVQARLYRGSYDQDPTHIYRPSGTAFSDLVESAGFRTVWSAYAPFIGGIWRWVPAHPAYLAIFGAR